ncbi:hypothetical protein [Kineococcus sp. SYSU DK006]|uniref:hypothetical protein n=1 Tax=Kineococcus sp. SYSU DK006 TaxID=3383127 RepID=UPI003D7D11C3
MDGHPWDTPAAAALVRERAGESASLHAYAGPERFDIGNLLVATDGAVDRFGHDVRRLRPNLLIGGGQVWTARGGTGAAARSGGTVPSLYARARCAASGRRRALSP